MMEPSFEKCLGRLLDEEVDFIVVGGLAVTLNGYVRLTEDVDVLIDRTPENVERLIRALKGLGEGHGGEMKPQDVTAEPGAIRIIEESIGAQIDIFTQMAGLVFSDLITDAEEARMGDRAFRFASKAQLIRLKETSLREKDRLDVIALRQLIEDPGAFD